MRALALPKEPRPRLTASCSPRISPRISRHSRARAASLYFEYAKRGGSAAKSATEGFTLSQREWVQFVKDCKVPIPITEINDVFRRVDRAEKEVRRAVRRDAAAAPA